MDRTVSGRVPNGPSSPGLGMREVYPWASKAGHWPISSISARSCANHCSTRSGSARRSCRLHPSRPMADGRMAMRRRLRYGSVSCLANMGTRCSRCPYFATKASGQGSGPSAYLRLMGPHAARTSSSISWTLAVGVPSGRAINTTGGENPSSLSQRYTAPGLVPHSACSEVRHACTRSRSSRCTCVAASLFSCAMHSSSVAADGIGAPALATACGVSGNRASSGIRNSCSRCTRRRSAHQAWDVLSPLPRTPPASRCGGCACCRNDRAAPCAACMLASTDVFGPLPARCTINEG